MFAEHVEFHLTTITDAFDRFGMSHVVRRSGLSSATITV